jgi:hypothetical protein
MKQQKVKTIDGVIRPMIQKPSFLRRLLDRFCAYESMSGNGACPVYLERWTLLELLGCGLYLHHFLGDDWAIDPHDHPRRFISIGLWGWYYEDVYDCVGNIDLGRSRRYRAPWLRSFPAEHLHRVRAAECGNVWTLVLVLRKSRPWGFVQGADWIPFRSYVFGGKSRKSC